MYNKKLYNKIIKSISKVVKKLINEAFDFSNISDNKSKNVTLSYNHAWILQYIDRLLQNDATLWQDENFMKILTTETPLYKAKSKEEIRTIYKAGLELIGPSFPLRFIDVSEITDMSEMFILIEDGEFCGIDNWDVSNVTNMKCMFANCKHFRGIVNNWDVSNVTDMSGMFRGCRMFDGNGLENWDVSNVTDMNSMFNNCVVLNTDFSKWDVSNVIDMSRMFRYCEKFMGIGLSNWDVSKVDNMLELFYGDTSLKKLHIETWNPTTIAKKPIYDRLTAMSNMFAKSSLSRYTPKWFKKLCKD